MVTSHLNKMWTTYDMPLIVSTLPFWYTRSPKHSVIKHGNKQLKLHLREKNTQLFKINFSSEKEFTRRGLHMNLLQNMHSLTSLLYTSIRFLRSLLRNVILFTFLTFSTPLHFEPSYLFLRIPSLSPILATNTSTHDAPIRYDSTF